MFIAKWSPEALALERGKHAKPPKPAELLDDRSLVKWETSDPGNVQGQAILRVARELVKTAHNGKIPTVLDPFAGGGAIPLEAGRLGCQPIANDYNPVAYLILRATCEFPQKYGKPGKRKVLVEEFGKKIEMQIEVPNVLVHNVEKWANWILERACQKIGHLYPPGKDGRPVVGYLWARTTPCSNPSCRGEIPLLRSLLLCNKKDKKVALTINVDLPDRQALSAERQPGKERKTVRFGIARDKNIKWTEGTTVSRGAKCPFCKQITHVDAIKEASFTGKLGERIVAVIVEGKNGKDYRLVEDKDIQAFETVKTLIDPSQIPNESMPESPDLVSGRGWNFKTWGCLFNSRQLVAMQTFVACLHDALEAMKDEIAKEEYRKGVGICLALWVSRTSMFLSNMGLWKPTGEFIAAPFSRQAIPMVWDYPEINGFADSSGGALGQLDWILRVIRHESFKGLPASTLLSDGSYLPMEKGTIDYVVTDPPYFDAISYGDLSDYFYIWLKRILDETMPEVVMTPLTPKRDEVTALRHRHNGRSDEADEHFKSKLTQVLWASKEMLKTGGMFSIMFAHQSTKAWTALITALFEAGLNIDATWPIDTEREVRAVALGTSSLASSITVSCRPRIAGRASSFKEVRGKIERVVQESIKRFWSYGFRGADLIVACYGPAVGVFGKYERVEKADGTPV